MFDIRSDIFFSYVSHMFHICLTTPLVLQISRVGIAFLGSAHRIVHVGKSRPPGPPWHRSQREHCSEGQASQHNSSHFSVTSHDFGFRLGSFSLPGEGGGVIARSLTRKASRSTGKQSSASAKDQFAEWRRQSATMREKYKVSPEYSPWSSQARLRGLTDNPRTRDLVDLAWIARSACFPEFANKAEIAKNFFVNTSQAVGRTPWSTGCMTLAQSTTVYSFEKDLALSGYDMLRLLGAPTGCAATTSTTKLTDSNLRSLAGEAYSAPVAGVVAYAFWLSPWGCWWRGDEDQATSVT